MWFVSISIWVLIFVLIYFKFQSPRIESGSEKDVDSRNYYLPYKVKRTIMTEHERLLFGNLRSVLGHKYDIYPQVNLDKIFYIERQKAYKFYLGWLRRINQKSVDFLVVSKDTQSPVFAIELDDSSHESEDRIERDKFVQEIFLRNNFPLIRFNPGRYTVEELRMVLQKYL